VFLASNQSIFLLAAKQDQIKPPAQADLQLKISGSQGGQPD